MDEFVTNFLGKFPEPIRDYDREYRRYEVACKNLKRLSRRFWMGERPQFDEVYRVVESWAVKEFELENHKSVPDYIKHILKGRDFRSTFAVVLQRDYKHGLSNILMKVTMLEGEFDYGFNISESDVMKGRTNLIELARIGMTEILEKSSEFMFKKFGGVPDGVLVVWEDEYIY